MNLRVPWAFLTAIASKSMNSSSDSEDELDVWNDLNEISSSESAVALSS